VFQPEAYVKYLISSHSLLEGPVKVFIRGETSMRLWVVPFKIILRQERVLIPQSKIIQREYK